MAMPDLTEAEIRQFGEELDVLKNKVQHEVGERDARYIRRIHRAVRYLGLLGRLSLMVCFWLPTFWVGVAALALSKILDNMELGHNVIHGQFDFMGDKHLNGKKFEWDILGTSNNWRETHNYKHHTYTNIQGHDDDIGYDIMRVFPEQPWQPAYRWQPLYAFVFAFVFQWGVALQNVAFKKDGKSLNLKEILQENPEAWRKMKSQLLKDYVFFPLLAGPGFFLVILGNALANMIRSLWTFMIIFCGHFTADAVVFPESAVKQEGRGHWYLRQILGSSNIRGSRLFHILSGNLSHQIEHHLFPDVPANRYAELAPKVQDICERYRVPYNTGSLPRQFGQVIWRICRYSTP